MDNIKVSFDAIVTVRSKLYDICLPENRHAYSPTTYRNLEVSMMQKVDEFVDKIEELGLNEDAVQTVRAYVQSHWYTWNHFVDYVSGLS